jgi:hypothetical protein
VRPSDRYLDIRVPIPSDAKHASDVSQPFRDYYQNLSKARGELRSYFSAEPNHHFFIGAADEAIGDVEEVGELEPAGFLSDDA